MNLTLLELIVLKETPCPFDALTHGAPECRTIIAQRAMDRVGDPSLSSAVAGSVLDILVAKSLIRRVNGGLFRRTHEGNASLRQNLRQLHNITTAMVF